MSKAFKLLLGGVFVFFCGGVAMGQFVSDLVSGRMKVKGLVVPLYAGMEQTPSMIVRVDNFFTDYERKGFFRIGVLPLGVMEGVTFEVCQLAQVTNSLVSLNDWIDSQAVKRVEFRKLCFLNLAGSTNRLDSTRARIISADKWELLDGVCFRSGTNLVEASRATLQVVGVKAGQIIMKTSPPVTNNLFAYSETAPPQQKVTP